MRFLFLLACWALGLWIAGSLFQYSLWSITGKDVPWYADAIGGLVLNGVNIPIAVICWVLRLGGVDMPFVHV